MSRIFLIKDIIMGNEWCDFSNRIEIVWLLGGYALSAAKY